MLTLSKVTRSEMGAYMCIASNGVPPTVSKRMKLQVHCEYESNLTSKPNLTFYFSFSVINGWGWGGGLVQLTNALIYEPNALHSIIIIIMANTYRQVGCACLQTEAEPAEP